MGGPRPLYTPEKLRQIAADLKTISEHQRHAAIAALEWCAEELEKNDQTRIKNPHL